MNRRHFIKSLGQIAFAPYAVGGLASLLSLPYVAAAEPSNDHFLLVIRIWGAMDCTVGLNPWLAPNLPGEENLFLDENYKVLNGPLGTQLNLGPAAHALAPYAKNLSLVNGIFMGPTDLGHPAAQNYISTSKSSPDTPHMIAEFAESYRRSAGLQRETLLFDGQLRTFDIKTLSKVPLKKLMDESGGNDKGSEIPDLKFSGDNPMVQEYQQSLRIERERQLFYSLFKKLRVLYPDPKTSNTGNRREGEQIEELILDTTVAAALAGGVARYVQMDWNYQSKLDLHNDFPNNHLRGQMHAWNRLGKLLKILSSTLHPKTKKALFPHHVTLAALTEFSRTPTLNRNRGKDHNYFDNSILLGGRGIQGGKVIGDHRLFTVGSERNESQLSGCHIDFKTGATVINDNFTTKDPNRIIENSEISLIRPENILRTLGDVLKVDLKNIRLFSESAKPLPGLAT